VVLLAARGMRHTKEHSAFSELMNQLLDTRGPRRSVFAVGNPLEVLRPLTSGAVVEFVDHAARCQSVEDVGGNQLFGSGHVCNRTGPGAPIITSFERIDQEIRMARRQL